MLFRSGVLQGAQQEAMRRSDTCSVTFNTGTDPITVSSCLSNINLPDPVNLSLSSGSTIKFGFRGNTNNNNTLHFSTEAVNEDKCLAISMPLGIIREGIYDTSDEECQKP